MHNLSTLILVVHVSVILGSSAGWSAEPPTTAIAFSPDGDSVVVGSQAGIRILTWPKLATQKSVEFASSLKNINDLAFSRDGKQLAAAGGTPGEDGIVELFSWPGAKLHKRFHLHDDVVYRVAWRDGDDIVATASLDHTSKLVQLATGKVTRTISGHSRGLTGVCFLLGGKTLVTAGIDQSVRVWNANTGKSNHTLSNHTQPIRDLAARPASQSDQSQLPMVASISDDHSVRLWQPTIGRMVRFARLEVVPLAAAWLPDGSRIVVSCTDGRIRVIDPDTVETVAELDAVEGWGYSLAVHLSGDSALVGGRNGQLNRVDLTTIQAPDR